MTAYNTAIVHLDNASGMTNTILSLKELQAFRR
jgi:hypothetical protein